MDENIWEDSEHTDSAHTKAALDTVAHQQHLPCFARSLQIGISDGLKDCKSIDLAMAKDVKLTSALRQSIVFIKIIYQ